MRKLITIFFLIAISVNMLGNGAPFSRAHITEVYFGENFSKTIEIRFDIINPFYDSAYCIYSATDSAFFKVNPTEPGVYLITYLDLTSPFIVNKSGDSLYIMAFRHSGKNEKIKITPTRFIFGDITKSRVNSPLPGQSLVGLPDSADTWSNNIDKYPVVVLDTCPSLGYERDPVRGTIEGYVYDSLNQPVPYQYIYLEGIVERVIWSDENGYFIDSTVYGMNYWVSLRDEDGNKTYSDTVTVNPGMVSYKNIIIPYSAFVEVDGWINPENTTVNPGAYAILTPECPYAPIDTISTDSTGHFIGTVYSGNYYIRYSKPGYTPWFSTHLNSIFEDKTLSSRILNEGYVGEIERGSISGRWTNNKDYYVFGDILLNNSDSLIIDPGAQIYFCGHFSIRIEGTFYGIGDDDNKIGLSPHNSLSNFNEVKIIGTESSGSVFRYVSIEDFQYMTIHNSSPSFENFHIDNNPGERNIISGNSEPNFRKCGGDSPWQFGSYRCIEQSKPVFQNNLFWSPGGTQLIIEDSSCPQFLYNTFYHYWTGLCSYSENAIPSFTGNIFCNGGDPTWMFRGGTPDFHYNSFYDISDPLWYDIPGFGILNIINLNGDSCDIYGNIFDLDPLLEDPENGIFTLLFESPCIDAGDPDSPYDPDNTIADMGAFFYDQIGIFVEEKNEFDQLYGLMVIPNPNRGDFSISIDSRLNHYYDASLVIYSINGDLIDTRNIAILDKGENLIRYSGVGMGSKLNNGLFICTLNIAGRPVSSTKILIINE